MQHRNMKWANAIGKVIPVVLLYLCRVSTDLRFVKKKEKQYQWSTIKWSMLVIVVSGRGMGVGLRKFSQPPELCGIFPGHASTCPTFQICWTILVLCGKGFTCIISLNLTTLLARWVFLTSPFTLWEIRLRQIVITEMVEERFDPRKPNWRGYYALSHLNALLGFDTFVISIPLRHRHLWHLR